MDENMPQADPRQLERIAKKWWMTRTHHPFQYVLTPGFFDSIINSGVAPNDRIDLIALGDTPATHATLVVDGVSNETGQRVKVSVLARYERQPSGA
jgi:hypothetical protein